MIQTLKKNLTLVTASIALMLGIMAAVPAAANAQTPTQGIQGGVNCGSDLKLDTGCSKPTGADTSLNTLIKNIINIFSAIVGAVCVIMIIIGGFRYVTSGGDSNNVGGAKNTILYAIVGLIIVAFAQIIVRFVLQTTT